VSVVKSDEPGWPVGDIVVAAQKGDVDAIRALLTASHPHVHRFARTVCLSEQDAEDATQEAMIILYRKIGTLRASAALASWIFQIVRNECLRLIVTARRRRQEPIDSVQDASHDATLEDEVIQRLEVERVAFAIAELPDDQRRVLILRDVYGHSGKHVANSLGLSVAAMKSRLHRARIAVRDRLDVPYKRRQPPSES
jgi:RNA polymerase sigma factor (sigma-70 family)